MVWSGSDFVRQPKVSPRRFGSLRAVEPPAAAPRRPAPQRRFRVPALRGPIVARPHLLSVLDAAMDAGHLITVVAGAGFGKTTLLAQWAGALPPDTRVAWIAVDRLDATPIRRLRTLVESVNALYPEEDPCDADRLCRIAGEGDAGAQHACDELCEVLADRGPDRLVWIWDDVQAVQESQTWGWIDRFLDRLPPNVTVALASREQTGLPTARRRARGQLTGITQDDLFLDRDETRALLEHGASGPLAASADELAASTDELHARTGGWAAGLRLLSARRTPAGAARGAPSGPAGTAELFEYLAQEVLASLPAELASLLSACCVLDEIDPAAAARVAQIADTAQARALIESLIRRNLFLSVTDPLRPSVRLHDLLRDHLLAQAARDDPQRLRTLHLRAAGGQDDPVRRVHHLLAAGEPRAAIVAIAPHAERLIKGGRGDVLARLFEPLRGDELRALPHANWIDGWLAWFGSGNFAVSARCFAAAAEGFERNGEATWAVRSRVLLARVASYAGDIALAAAQMARLGDTPDDPVTRCEWRLEHAWLDVAQGRADAAGERLLAIADEVLALRSPEVCVRLADRLRPSYFVGTRPFVDVFERVHGLIGSLRDRLDEQTLAHGAVMGAWAALWAGRIAQARERVAPVAEDIERWRGYRALRVDTGVLCALLATVRGDAAAAVAEVERLLERVPGTDASAAALWDATYLWMAGRLAWQGGDAATLRRLYARLLALHRGAEWPFMRLAREHLEGLLFGLEGDARAASERLARVVGAREAFSLISGSGDPRLELADALLADGSATQAWALARQTLREALDSGVIGPLLLVPASILRRLHAVVPREDPDRLAMQSLLALCAGLRDGTAADAAPGARAAADGAGEASRAGTLRAVFPTLTARELEVLDLIARGAPNKRIALALDLSLHTVKRHVANILDKTGAASRAELISRCLRRADGG